MDGKHGIRIPGILLDEMKDRDYSNDERFQLASNTKSKKRNSGKQLGRKERRKQQRQEKKHSNSGKNVHFSNERADSKRTPTSRMRDATSKQVHTKVISQKVAKPENKLPFSSDDSISSDDFDDFDEDDLDEEEWEQLRELENDASEESEIDEGHDEVDEEENEDSEESEDVDGVLASVPDIKEKELTVEQTMAALKAMKEKKGRLQNRKDNSKSQPSSHTQTEEEEVYYPMAPSDRAAAERDEMDMQYYAKKLGLKGKSKKIHARDEFDAIGGLLEGLDYFESFGVEDEDYGDLEYGAKGADESVEVSPMDEGDQTNVASSDDELSSGDFDEFDENDLDEEEWRQLRELEEGSEEEEESDGNESTSSTSRKRIKENPLVPPVEQTGDNYVPPSLRKKQLESEGETATEIEVKKKVKSSLNKLSDSNITAIISSLNELYDRYPRQIVTVAVINQLVEIIGQKNKLLDSFIINYSAILYSLWKLRGNDIGAFFIQSVVESFLKYFEEQNNSLNERNKVADETTSTFTKEPSNLLSLIAYCYNFGIISSKLIYDLIHLLVKAPNQLTTELLLRVISISGSSFRGDDPSALKDIISVLLTNVKSIENQPPRLKFLLDTVSDLKNNRLKPSMLAASHKTLKKKLQSFLKVSTISSDALLVSLEDIRNVDVKGKWWLVGASWRGNMDSAVEETQASGSNHSNGTQSAVLIDDDLLEDTPDWAEIAKQQRMNTDVRRAIFISIMSAQDFFDAFTKLEKLNLKRKQTLEIPRILLHCLSQDGNTNGYNPYYAFLASKLCESQHALAKSFQFLFWEIIKAFEDDGIENDFRQETDLDEDTRLKNVANQGKFFGFLIAEGTLKLEILKHISLISGLNAEGIQFMELLLFQMLLRAAKKSEKKIKTPKGHVNVTYKDDILHDILSNGVKIENRSVILKGLRFFLKKNFKYKNYIAGRPGEKSYDRDYRRLNWSITKFKDMIGKELENDGY